MRHKWLKNRRYKLIDRAGIFSRGGILQSGEQMGILLGSVTFQGVETESAHINGTDGDNLVYTFCVPGTYQCESEPARECGGSGN
jgi:hypothetical protein